MDTYLAQREAKKKAQRDAINARVKAEKAAEQKQQASRQVPNGTVRIGTTNMTQKQLEDVLKKYKVS